MNSIQEMKYGMLRMKVLFDGHSWVLRNFFQLGRIVKHTKKT